MAITEIRIFPSIGIARLGNSPEFFIGPEIPGNFMPPPGGYKDGRCRVKRQAARFRLFGYDANGSLVQEITAADAAISWTVELANTKGSWRRFNGLNASMPGRNGLTGAAIGNSPAYEIKPGAKMLAGANQTAKFDTGKFQGKTVPLGEMRTENDGRLLVIGGFGASGSVPATGVPITNYANNDNWHDDTSDGPVTATVTLNGQAQPITAKPAWVICAPPDFAPPIGGVTTLYDTLLQSAIDNNLPGVAVPAKPSLTNDIYPILQRTFDLKWVMREVGFGHADFDGAGVANMNAGRRQTILSRIRDPNNLTASATADMPELLDDNNLPQLTVTKTQYAILQKWAMGSAPNDWIDDWTGIPVPPMVVDPTKPEELTRAALESCIGAAMYPGIEASWMLRDSFTFSEPFRLQHETPGPNPQTLVKAGDVTKQMAVPWQADFLLCRKENKPQGTIGWWPSQRPDDVHFVDTSSATGTVIDDSWARTIIGNYTDMVNHWHKLGFVIDQGNQMLETERRVTCNDLDLITDRSRFAFDEVEAALIGGAPATFENAFYVIAEGFLPAELGVTTANPTQVQLAAFAPATTVRREDGSAVPGMSAKATGLLLQNTSLPPNLRQRFTFVYRIEFANNSAFSINAAPVEFQKVFVEASKTVNNTAYSEDGVLTLTRQPNPYMLDGPTHWLSTDLRVFQISEGQSLFGNTMGTSTTAATTFLGNVLDAFNTHVGGGHPFDTISINQQTSKLELSQMVGGNRVYNFAIARVRYRGKVLDAQDVRVFFRLFTTAASSLEFDEHTTYRRGPSGAPVSLLGLKGGELVTIPCYGDARVDTTASALTVQTDNRNKRTLARQANGQEVQGYFGCWLDFNQTTPRFPQQPSPADGPWTSNLKSVQELIRGRHQCLVAEIFFADDPIGAGATPGSSENLSQRNLAIVESDNPGSVATHTVQHTFEIQAPRYVPEVRETFALFTHAGIGVDDEMPWEFLPPEPDELVIRWGDLPPETRMSLYLPGVDVDEIVRHSGQSHEVPGFEKIDAHTLLCHPADVTFVPLPFNCKQNIPALISIELPGDVHVKQVFTVMVQQVSGRERHTLGAFQITIPVRHKEDLLEAEARDLSVLKHIGAGLSIDDRWRAVFERYVGHIGERVRGFGADPEAITPSPDGSGSLGSKGVPPGGTIGAEQCGKLSWLYTLVLAFLLVVSARLPVPGAALGLAVAALAAVALAVWLRWCRDGLCGWLRASLKGLGLGAAVTALLLLAGAAPSGVPVLALSTLAAAAVYIWGSLKRCW